MRGPLPQQEKRPKRQISRGVYARWLLAAVGAGCFALLVFHLGWRDIKTALQAALWTVPLVGLLEFVRVYLEALSARTVVHQLYGPQKTPPLRVFVQAQFVAHAVMNLFPGGRAAAEAVKGTLFARSLGVAEVVVAGTINQVIVLYVLGFATLACAWAAGVAGQPAWMSGFLVHSLFAFAGGVGLRALQTLPGARRYVARIPKLQHLADELAHGGARIAFFPLQPFFWMAAGRMIQFAELGLLVSALRGVGDAPGTWLMHVGIAEGLTLAGAVTGSVVPGQAGTAEAVFASGAAMLGLLATQGMALGVLLRLGQSQATLVGLAFLFRWRYTPVLQKRTEQEPPEPKVAQDTDTPSVARRS